MIMKQILRKYSETTLILLALIFLGIIVTSFIWGIGDVVREVNRAVSTKGSAGGNVGFNLKDAAALDLRGLVKQ